MQEKQVRSLGWGDPLENEMATHSSILSWEILWTEETDGLQSIGSQRIRHDWATELNVDNMFCTELTQETFTFLKTRVFLKKF